MGVKNQKSNLKTANSNRRSGYNVLTDQNFNEVFSDYAESMQYDRSIASATFPRRRDFSNLTTYTSGKPGLTNSDWDWFRDEHPPGNSKEKISFGRYAYQRIGLVHNAIDIMGDFTHQGIRITHPNKKIEKIGKTWWHQINGDSVSERFCNLLFREANVVVRMKTAVVNKQKRSEMERTSASADMKINDTPEYQKGEIPWQYVFLDNLLVDVVGGQLSSIVGQKDYVLKFPSSLHNVISRLKSSEVAEEREFVTQLPSDIRKALENNYKGVMLPRDKTFVYSYKKDDWQEWADPIVVSAYRDLDLYEKLKLADRAALDGAVSKIRVWKLGNLDAKLYPTPEMSSALNEILSSAVGGGVQDIIWGPDIELLETSTDIQNFLGEDKYKPTLMAIYACLGIPPTLTGTFGAGGTTNNYISLKTLTERLAYARGILIDFWKQQLKIFQKTMGFRQPFEIEFDFTYLDDPSSIMNLLIQMADRNIVSDEFVQRQIKANPDIESKRLEYEGAQREEGNMAEKVSPYHKVDKEFELKRLSLQTGVATPGQVGIELDEKKSGEKNMLELRQAGGGTPGAGPKPGGRPNGAVDTKKRSPKTFSPKSKAAIAAWARDAQKIISSVTNSALLEYFNKKDMRSLTAEEFMTIEDIKFNILCNSTYTEDLNKESIKAAMNSKADPIVRSEFKNWLIEAESSLGRKLSVDEIRDLRSNFYAEYQSGEVL